jgi:hypothetical protein
MLDYAKQLVKERAEAYLHLFHYFADDLAAYACIYCISDPPAARQFLLDSAQKELAGYLEAKKELMVICHLQEVL